MRTGTVLKNDSVSDESPLRYTIYLGRDNNYTQMIYPHNGSVKRGRYYTCDIGENKDIYPVGHVDTIRKISALMENDLEKFKNTSYVKKPTTYDDCKGCRYERETKNSVHCQGCKKNAVDKYIKRTNADRIREMTNEELAEFLLKVNTAYAEPYMTGETAGKWEDCPTHDKVCKDCFKEWLESECDAE